MMGRTVRRSSLLVGLAAALVMGIGSSSAAAQDRPSGVAAVTATTLQYVTQFYPRWVSNAQEFEGTSSNNINKLIGTKYMSPVFGFVVAPNDDTLYAGSFFDVTDQPLILTVPRTRATYSVLSMDTYGNVFSTLQPGEPGRYAIVGPGWHGKLPVGVKRVRVPVDLSFWIIRADKFSPTGVNQIAEADLFRTRLRLATLSQYEQDRSSGAAKLVPPVRYATRFQVISRDEISSAPIIFLRELQEAVHNSGTPPLTGASLKLSRRFDLLFGNGQPAGARRVAFARATQAAYARFIAHYLTHTDSAKWVFFNDIGAWGTNYLDRSATTAYLQFSNTLATAAYFQAFQDGNGRPLNGARHGYILTFSKRQLPQAKRFWSLTAYLNGSITLVPNAARKYVVASYTPGLQTNKNGSVSIYMSQTKPAGVTRANWLPIPAGTFNVALRVYGPEGRVAKGKYVPPAIQPLR
jgi:hypothetical protein